MSGFTSGSTSLLTRRAVLLAKLEATYNVDPIPSPATDGVLVEAPDFVADMTVLQREFVHGDLSTVAHQIGRKLSKMSFTTELRGNGKQNSGSVGDVPVIARLFQGCGYALTGHAAAFASPIFSVGDELDSVSWAISGALTNTDVIFYYISVVTGGPSGTATVQVTSDTTGEGGGAVETVTSGTAMAVGTKGLQVTPTFTGNLTAGQSWVVWACPPGSTLDPISDDFDSLTLYLYLDGTLHRITGCEGTFSIDATGGQYAKVKWEFTGQYSPLTDVPLVSPVFETTLPPQVQLARLLIDNGFVATVNAMTFTQTNTIQPRPDVNGTDAYDGVRLTARNPEGGIDPEATLVASYDFWGRMAAAVRMPFQMRVGTVAGNTVWMMAPSVQYNKMTYKDRTGLRVYDAGLNFRRVNGDDEVRFLFA